MKSIIKLHIQAWKDREMMVIALTNSGYKTWIKIEDSQSAIESDKYYVCIEK